MAYSSMFISSVSFQNSHCRVVNSRGAPSLGDPRDLTIQVLPSVTNTRIYLLPRAIGIRQSARFGDLITNSSLLTLGGDYDEEKT